ncbi:PhzF family phenazine biosynthesis protein [Thalassomonas actiniarum]|uniref:PhzF family phenazine biosynthesis protein n=1 Tax=Thalassomonas actiniarum TaxID=485447 RepID=A0AAE9YVX0_9GAMM|nr:PhzF family phenazine biosynthesis protein [Thalassomonas actiniarum]WDE01324.1 PhzF family phenazine biosynthesis protein [Thalassomonas actiniarum]
MTNIEVTLVNSFTENGKGGNPAGVVLNADQLSDAQKLKIAQAVGYSETAFVSSDDEVDYEVSFFTTTGEVDFCGHATLATFSTMYKKGLIAAGSYIQRTKAGILPVSIEPDGKVVMDQQLPQKLDSFSYQEISNVIGIESHILASTKLPIEVVSTGLPDVIIPVPNGYLDVIVPDDELIAGFCKKHKVVGFHVFELCDPESELTASCRNFAPLFGISEESATGSSSGALACYLTEHLTLGSDYVFEQGRAMNCTSIITASVKSDNSTVINVKVGGFASNIDTVAISV